MSIIRVIKYLVIGGVGIVVVPIALVVLLVVTELTLSRFIPSQVVEFRIDELNATLQLRLYSASPLGAAEFNRELVVSSDQESLTQQLMFDWGGASRTSIYITQENELAILGPAGDNHLIAFKPLRVVRFSRMPSDQWVYLGAFDRGAGSRFSLRFFLPNEQKECIPTLMAGDSGGPHRTAAYKLSCPEQLASLVAIASRHALVR